MNYTDDRPARLSDMRSLLAVLQGAEWLLEARGLYSAGDHLRAACRDLRNRIENLEVALHSAKLAADKQQAREIEERFGLDMSVSTIGEAAD